MKYSKEYIIAEYKKLKEQLGESPSSRVFCSKTGIHQRHLNQAFGSNSFSKLVSECGDTPQEFFKPKSDIEEILIQWGNLARSIGKIPTTADWTFYNCQPTTDGISRSHNLKWSDLQNKFLDFYSNKNEWIDIIALIPERIPDELLINKNTAKVEGLTYEYLKFIPPIVQDLVELSMKEEKSREFEKHVNLVFQMLGFEITSLGQGSGRKPDGIAKENQHRYAILIDAKSRKDNYKIGTEDRKFIEYIKTFSDPLRKQGFTNIYFLVVSSSFDSVALKAIKNIKVETQVSITFLTSRLLLKILSRKIQSPSSFDMKKFQELLIEDGEIIESKVDKFLARLI